MLRKILIFLITILCLCTCFGQFVNTGASMEDIYCSPMIDEAPRNIILQNRCGNRLTMLFFEDRTDFQFIYKPNAFRRKEYVARNFSNRDNYTTLFSKFTLPQLQENYIHEWGYDPFVTTLKSSTPWDAKNEITIINIADENAFA
ncbi:MAG TPA: hypothetical protein VJ946_12010, partial [Bacteroidales bacterium]|nr:hypothetical protein [Bacteroidales bacterium]